VPLAAIVLVLIALWAWRAKVPCVPLSVVVLVGLPVMPAVATSLSVAALALRLRGMEQQVFVIHKYLTCGLKNIFEGVGLLAAHTQELGDEAQQ
jgi:hypothetical protein